MVFSSHCFTASPPYCLCCIIRAMSSSSKIDSSVRYLKTHEWARPEGDVLVVGISDHAQEAMSDLVYVELPKVGQVLNAGDTFGVVESVKAASDVYAPVAGIVTAVNEAVTSAPELINQDPYGAGWLMQIKPTRADDWHALLDATAYEQLLKEEEH
jgi:glycine cleavage system H protein